MDTVLLLPLLVCVLGLVVYMAASTNAKLAECGRLMFACGLLVTLLRFAGHVLRL